MKVKSIISIILFSLFTLRLWAVPAYPNPIEIIQPDGSSLTIIQKGDEYYSWIETTDGYSIMKNANGIFEYVKLDKGGNVVLSGVKVRNVNERYPTETTFTASIPQSQIRTRLFVQQNEIMRLKIPEAPSKVQTSVTGTRKVLCILIDFTDRPFSKLQNEFHNLMNETGYNANSAIGSVKDYFMETSYGNLNLDIIVVGPYTANNNMAYYGADVVDVNGNRIDDIRPKELITEAVEKANPDVNYAEYDYDNDGYVDGVHVIFAGYDQSANVSALPDAIWSHKWQIPEIKLDNKWVQTYSCSSELRGSSGNLIATIGTACHEFGHVLGAPDFYDILSDSLNYIGTGEWDLMAHGSWNGPWGARGSSPAHINPYTKINTFGWATAKNLPVGNGFVTLYSANSNNNSFYKIATPTSGECFLIENRQWLGFDAFLPGHGMIVWHVHKDIESDSRAINTTHPQRLYPICASATQNPNSTPNSYGNINSGGCPFPGTSNHRSLTFSTTPGLRSWTGDSTGKDLQFITTDGNNITFVVNPQISGPSTLCSQATYTIDNLPEGAAVQWNVNRILSIVSGQGTDSVVVQKRTDGIAAISAVVSINGQDISLPQKMIQAGSDFPVFALYDAATNMQVQVGTVGINHYFLATGSNLPGHPADFYWTVISPNPDDIPMNFSGEQFSFLANGEGYYSISLKINGECGWSAENIQSIYFQNTNNGFALFPNPASENVTVSLTPEEAKGSTIETFVSESPRYQIQLWSSSGLVKQVETDQKNYLLNLIGVPPGFYYVHVIKDGQTYRRQLVVQ